MSNLTEKYLFLLTQHYRYGIITMKNQVMLLLLNHAKKAFISEICVPLFRSLKMGENVLKS